MKALEELIGHSPGIAAVREQVGRLLGRQSDSRRLPPILIQGETGTGKGLLARGIHQAGPRHEGPFVDVNCAAIPETLLEAELFGFERGAFTDARHAKAGLFQTAHRGTLFLDEVGLLPDGLQAKLLTAIEERVVRRLGSTRNEPADAWIITATNADLAAAARARRFREDLYHRLAVVTLWLPPLRERGEDILLLAEHFLARACTDYRLPTKRFTPDTRAALLTHPWPGNIRELANAMERVALLSEAPLVTPEMLGLREGGPPAGSADESPLPKSTRLEDAVGVVEREHLLEALRETGWNITHAAQRLGISRDTLRYRIAKHELRPGPAPTRRRPARPPASAPAAPSPAPPDPVAVVPAPTMPRWERRRVTFLRAALALPPDTDPRLYASRTQEVLVDKVESFGGRIEELSPTGIVGAFGLDPVEDAPRRAAHAAMAIRKAAERAGPGGAEPLGVRCAIHVAQCLVGQSGSGVQIDLDGKRQAASVLEGLVSGAEPEGILASEAARPFLERHLELTALPGVARAHGPAFRVTAPEHPGLTTGRRITAFVGRQDELDLLRGRLASAIRGHAQVVGILGEAGIGKSRLLDELLRSTQEDVRLTVLEARCESFASAVPYRPVLDILHQNFRIAEGDGPEVMAQKVRVGLQELEMDVAASAPYVLHLLGVKEDPERLAALTAAAIKFHTFEVLRQMVLTGARRRPIVFVLEDLQWTDSMSEECFASLMESAQAGAPAMVLATYRPGYRPPWLDRSYATQVALEPLSTADSLSLVRSVLRRPDVPAPLAQLILDKTEGNPFFLEELARAVAETGELPATVPDTIEEVLLARIERLPPAAKRLLQTAAVLGRHAPLSLLRALWTGPEELEPQLRELVRLEFLYVHSGGAEPVYAFTHVLTRDVAYETLPGPRRQTLHDVAGQALERAYADRLEEVYDRLAYHYTQTDRADRAVEYLSRLAVKAAGGHAHTEAVRIFEEAIRHVERLPAPERDRRLLELVLLQAYSLIPLGRFQEVVELLGRHQAVLDRLADPALAGQFHLFVGRSHLFLGDDARASHHARLGIAEATRCGDAATLGKHHYVLAQQCAMAGRPREGLDHGRQAIALFEEAKERFWIGPAYWALGLNHALVGDFEAALAAEARAAALGQAAGDPQVQSSAAWAAGIVHTALGRWDEGIAACQQARDLSPDPLNAVMALGWLGYAHLERGEPEPALPFLEEAVRLLDQFRFPQPRSMFLALLAETHRLRGELGAAREPASQALDIAQGSGAGFGLGLSRRALGRLALAEARLDEAALQLEQALETFEGMPAPYDAARTRLDLAAVAHARGDVAAAARHLAAAHAAFRTLRIPHYEAKAAELAARLGVALPEAARA